MTAKNVFVAVPMHNNEKTITKCLTSILEQSYQNYFLFISDDCSTDNSLSIAKAVLKGHSNYKIISQSKNLYYNHFPYLLKQAEGYDYCVWLAGDDFWDSDFLDKTVSFMEKNPEAMCCVPRCMHYKNGIVDKIASDTFPLIGQPKDKIKSFVEKGLNNNRMYGLFRRDIIKNCYPDTIMSAQDIAFTIYTLTKGDYYEIDEILMHRDFTPMDSYNKAMKRDATGFFDKLLPFNKATRWLLSRKDISLSQVSFSSLVKMNYWKHRNYFRYHQHSCFKFFSPIYHFIDKYIIWRF